MNTPYPLLWCYQNFFPWPLSQFVILSDLFQWSLLPFFQTLKYQNLNLLQSRSDILSFPEHLFFVVYGAIVVNWFEISRSGVINTHLKPKYHIIQCVDSHSANRKTWKCQKDSHKPIKDICSFPIQKSVLKTTYFPRRYRG